MRSQRHIILIAHNIRSCHNVGALLRTADGLGVEHVYLTGYTPYPLTEYDDRLPHLAKKIDAQIRKTALGAERSTVWTAAKDIHAVLDELKAAGWRLAALEQHAEAISLPSYQPENNIALLVGREVEGIEPEVLARCDVCLEIPMFGTKESFNVAAAAAMALYHLRFSTMTVH